MRLSINGEEKNIEEVSNITSLIDKFKLNINKVAIEVNLAIIPKSLYEQTILCDGDKIEIVGFIGGG